MLLCSLVNWPFSSGVGGGERGEERSHAPPGPGKINHKNDDPQKRPRFHVSWPRYPAAGYATVFPIHFLDNKVPVSTL